jgi:predicted anti-sigma-YlaC factor YlaD
MSEVRVITCEEALRFLAAYLDGELALGMSQDVETHLGRCRSCYSRSEFERRLKERVASLGRQEVTPEFARRIHQLLGRFTTPRPSEP